MKTTKIFTGHNLVLNDIQAVGPIMNVIESKSMATGVRTLTITIMLRGGGTIVHEAVKQSILGQATEEQVADFKAAVDQLLIDRENLINQWEYDSSFPAA